MTYRRPARRTTGRIPRGLVVGLLVVVAAIAAALGHPPLAPSPSTAASPIGAPLGDDRRALGAADGALPDGTTPFDDEVPGVAKLDPALLRALRRAATDAADDGVELFVNSGWRSTAYQERLLREALSTYGSAAEAARWVAAPHTSAHVSGDAVDVGPLGATAWLSEHGAAYGLCQIYRNEPWHYELRPGATAHGCPPMHADPARSADRSDEVTVPGSSDAAPDRAPAGRGDHAGDPAAAARQGEGRPPGRPDRPPRDQRPR